MAVPTAELKEQARRSLSALVGEEALIDDPEVLAMYGDCPGRERPGKPVLLVRPSEARQVRRIVLAANELGLNLVPASSTLASSRGGTVPEEEGIIVDLSGMRGIVRLDPLYKVAIIEPGVTFPQLKEAAEGAGLRVNMPLLPPAGKSVLASYLEREPIIMPRFHWDMTDPMLCVEIVFGTGDFFRTGSAAGPGSLEEQWKRGLAQRNPTGPAHSDFMRVVQGAQGTMGIVTWASVKLEVLPRISRMYFVPSARLDKLVDFAYRALRLKLGEEFFFLNSFALACILAEDPGGIKALAAKQSPYTVVYGVAGYEYSPEKRVAYQEQDIAAVAQAMGVNIKKEIPGANGRRMMGLLYDPPQGPHWKTRFKGGYRELFFVTTMDRAASLVERMQEMVAAKGRDPGETAVYIQPIQQGRACHVEFDLFYDPSDETEAALVGSLVNDAALTLAEAGAFFTRPYGAWADIAYSRCPDTVDALRKVKDILDPRGVLNKGKLCFGGV